MRSEVFEMNRILIVDDDRSVRILLRSILKKKGYETSECEDGVSAVEFCVKSNPDIVLLDLLMPDMHGLDVLKQLKENTQTASIPVIVLTGSTDQEDKLSALRSGAVDYISKPFVSEEVTLRVGTQLRIHELISSLQSAVRELENDLEAAGRIQRALVPSEVPQGIGVDINWIYMPSSSVGGDIFDIIPLEHSRYLVYVLDVSGHGINAALVSVMVHRFIEDFRSSISPEDGVFPLADFMKMLDASFLFERFETYMTASFVILDTMNGEVEVSNAGNPHPLLLQQGVIQVLDSENNGAIGFGIVEGITRKYRIHEGSKLLLFTDGIIDVRDSNGSRIGEGTVIDLLKSEKDSALGELFSRFRGLLKKHLPDTSRSFEDDITLVGIQF
ncbi:MAG TPA: response regulator receiver modulated serine phosphatase [Kosmotogaceae bacterium]|nr:response regulator receiver modulated serine phosphatase [Kosmotogaceae bacterium]